MQAAARLADLEAQDDAVVAAAEKASAAYYKLAGRNHDKPLSREAERARREMLTTVSRVESMGDALSQARDRIARLDDPHEIETRVREAERTRERLSRFTAGDKPATEGGTRRMAEPKNEVSAATRKRIVDAINAGRSLGDISRELDAEGVPPPGRTSAWGTGRSLRQIYMQETGVDGIRAVRDKHPLAKGERKPAARQKPAAKTPAKPKQEGGEVVPIDKKQQAAGRSRGGTGSRKKQ